MDAKHTINDTLVDVLRTKHPRWAVHSGQWGRIPGVKWQLGIVVRLPGGIPVVLETEYAPACTVEEVARARLWSYLDNDDWIEQAIAVQVPKALKRVATKSLEQRIRDAEYRYCTYTLGSAGSAGRPTRTRWPAEGWLTGRIDDLASCIENCSISPQEDRI